VDIELTVYASNGVIITGRLGPGKLGFQPTQIQIAIEHKIPGTTVGCFDFLRHVGNAATTGQRDSTLLRSQLAQQELEKTGFTGTIGTNNGNALAGLYRQADGF
jgi:hypothetical protein